MTFDPCQVAVEGAKKGKKASRASTPAEEHAALDAAAADEDGWEGGGGGRSSDDDDRGGSEGFRCGKDGDLLCCEVCAGSVFDSPYRKHSFLHACRGAETCHVVHQHVIIQMLLALLQCCGVLRLQAHAWLVLFKRCAWCAGEEVPRGDAPRLRGPGGHPGGPLVLPRAC